MELLRSLDNVFLDFEEKQHVFSDKRENKHTIKELTQLLLVSGLPRPSHKTVRFVRMIVRSRFPNADIPDISYPDLMLDRFDRHGDAVAMVCQIASNPSTLGNCLLTQSGPPF